MIKRYDKKEVLIAFLFLLPLLINFTLFKYYPLIENFRISLTSWNFFSSTKKFIGLKNFIDIFSSKLFFEILKNTLFYSVASTAISIFIGFLVAIFMNSIKSVFKNIWKTIFFIPNITTASAIAILWIWIFDPDFGLSGQLFSLFNMESPRWLLNAEYSMWVVISLTVWRSVGYVMLIYISGLNSIGEDIYEAAKLDGANGFQTLWKITVPLLAPTTYFLILTTLIQSMQVFDIIAVMTNGGPHNTTNVLNLYIYQMAFSRSKAGYASALSVILFLILLTFTLIQRGVSKKQGKNYV